MNAFGSLSKNSTRFLLNLVTRNLLAGVIVYCCCIPIMNYSWFSWHVILCTLGMVPLMTEALMLFPSDELWSTQMTRKEKYWIHGILFTVGTILVSAGSIDTFYYIEEGYHLYTVHGITGLVAMILFILSLGLGGLAANPQKFTKICPPIWFKFIHNFVGLIGYFVGVVSLCYAYYTDWFAYYTSEQSRILGLIATILATLWASNGALVSAYGQIRTLLSR